MENCHALKHKNTEGKEGNYRESEKGDMHGRPMSVAERNIIGKVKSSP